MTENQATGPVRAFCNPAFVFTNELAARIASKNPEVCRRLTGHEKYEPVTNMDAWFRGLVHPENKYPTYYKHNAMASEAASSVYAFGLTDLELAAWLFRRHVIKKLGDPVPMNKIIAFDGKISQLYPGGDNWSEELNGAQSRPVLYYVDIADLAARKLKLGDVFEGLLPTEDLARFLTEIDGTGIAGIVEG